MIHSSIILINNKGIRTPRQESQNRNTRYQINLYERQSPVSGFVYVSMVKTMTAAQEFIAGWGSNFGLSLQRQMSYPLSHPALLFTTRNLINLCYYQVWLVPT